MPQRHRDCFGAALAAAGGAGTDRLLGSRRHRRRRTTLRFRAPTPPKAWPLTKRCTARPAAVQGRLHRHSAHPAQRRLQLRLTAKDPPSTSTSPTSRASGPRRHAASSRLSAPPATAPSPRARAAVSEDGAHASSWDGHLWSLPLWTSTSTSSTTPACSTPPASAPPTPTHGRPLDVGGRSPRPAAAPRTAPAPGYALRVLEQIQSLLPPAPRGGPGRQLRHHRRRHAHPSGHHRRLGPRT
ncbi:hypothetical protein LV779_24755 [Streptomyces thinghirensis]|nr:hypothetical protein [Streptomyces thinghirensis]